MAPGTGCPRRARLGLAPMAPSFRRPVRARALARSQEITNWHKHCRGVWDLVMHPKLLDLVADLLGDSIALGRCRLSFHFGRRGLTP